jgi:hypothetical protein
METENENTTSCKATKNEEMVALSFNYRFLYIDNVLSLRKD